MYSFVLAFSTLPVTVQMTIVIGILLFGGYVLALLVFVPQAGKRLYQAIKSIIMIWKKK